MHPIASSNAYAFIHNDYKPEYYDKVVYIINTLDKKSNEIVRRGFQKAGIEAINILDIDTRDCDTGEKIQKRIMELGFKCIVQISIATNQRVENTFTTNKHKNLVGNVTASNWETWKDVYLVFEWYNNDFQEIPFLSTNALKYSNKPLSSYGRYYDLLAGCVNLLIFRPIKYGYLLNK